MNELPIEISLTSSEHEIVLDALNNYLDVIQQVVPGFVVTELAQDNPVREKYFAIISARQKLVESWSCRFEQV